MKISVAIKPNSRAPGVEKLSDSKYLVRVVSPARRGSANKELIDLLAKSLRIPKGNMEIVSGLKSRNKILDIK